MQRCILFAPMDGWAGPLDEAPDPVFADRIMGDGVLIDPTSGELRAPCDGVIISAPRTKHAVIIRAQNGAEILMHVGIETVRLNGAGFEVRVKEGQSVAAGDPLLLFDLDAVAEKATSLATPIIVVNGDAVKIARIVEPGPIRTGDFLMEVRARGAVRDLKTPIESGAEARQSVRVSLPHGIHARPAAVIAELAKRFESRTSLAIDRRQASARSPVALMSLGVRRGDDVEIIAVGADAHAAVREIAANLAARYGEAPQSVGASPLGPAGATPIPINGAEIIPLDGSITLAGAMGAPGIGVGPAFQLRSIEHDAAETGAGVDAERVALSRGLETVRESIAQLADNSTASQKEILSAHLSLLADETLIEAADNLIEAGRSAAFAWRTAMQTQIDALAALGDARMAERAADLKDIRDQTLAALAGGANTLAAPAGSVVICDDLAPSQFVRLATGDIAGVCMTGGGPTSHVAILAGEKGVPALVATDRRAASIPDGTLVIIDADHSRLQVAPGESAAARIGETIERRRSNHARARAAAHEECRTADGVRIEAFANLGASAEAERALSLGAEGCGLLRTEFLFLERDTPPSEEEQLAEYQAIADAFGEKPVIIRTLDIGGDKPAPYLDLPKEENPALGIRGVRNSLVNRELLKTQYRAILRVKTRAIRHIMLPMVASLDEITAARAILEEVQRDLDFSDNVLLGVMIETPSSAVIADVLAQEADFFSIGTNDLTQYVLAMDRGNPALAARIDGLHPAVLRMIEMTAAAGRAAGKWVGVCGSLASDLLAAPLLIGLGVTELSATPQRVPQVKALVRTLDFGACQAAARAALNCSSSADIRAMARRRWPQVEDWS